MCVPLHLLSVSLILSPSSVTLPSKFQHMEHNESPTEFPVWNFVSHLHKLWINRFPHVNSKQPSPPIVFATVEPLLWAPPLKEHFSWFRPAKRSYNLTYFTSIKETPLSRGLFPWFRCCPVCRGSTVAQKQGVCN